MLPGWTVPLPALVVALWTCWLASRPEQTLPRPPGARLCW